MAYASVAVEGGMFPADLLDRIAAGEGEGQRPADFGLAAGRRVTDETQGAFSEIRSYWEAFQYRVKRSSDSTTTLTRENWVIPMLQTLGFENIEFQRAGATVGNESYAVSHRAGSGADGTVVHIVALDQRLDVREGRRSPHALVQEYLNRSDAVWAILTNGRQLRLLRDTARLAKPTYLEFNLEAMVEANLYSEFVLLYRLIHASRFPVPGAAGHECLLERYYQQGIEEGGRVREKLRDGVAEALNVLGSAFLAHPESNALRARFESGALDAPAYYRQLLRLVYRLLFLMAAEERRLIFPSETPVGDQAIYDKYYSINRLRDRCERPFAEDRYSDLWLGLRQNFTLFREDSLAAKLGLHALNGELFGPDACADLERAGCTNRALLAAMFRLSTYLDDKVRRRVNYAFLDVEEFGSVYESLLDFHPQVTLTPPAFELVAGSERKQTGSYYTPPELVQELIERALVPVIQERLASARTREEKDAALLSLRVCDPAAGSGHFLLAAAHQIGLELARVRTGESEPTPTSRREATREVIRNCIYAVDKNPLAVDLCKVALWIEGHVEGLPLSFLDNHVKCGDSLVGVLELSRLAGGIPEDAYKPSAGDDRDAARGYRLRNERERGMASANAPALDAITVDFSKSFTELGLFADNSPAAVNEKEARYRRLTEDDPEWLDLRSACALWTYAYFAPLVAESGTGQHVPTNGAIAHVLSRLQRSGISGAGPYSLVERNAEIACMNHRFFDWPLYFPEVTRDRGGFDVVLGNPPWGQKEIEAGLPSRKFIVNHFSSMSGIFDWFRPFIERATQLVRNGGNVGFVLPDVLLLKDYEETRRFILEHLSIQSITWWGTVFPGVTVDAVTFIGEKGSPGNEQMIDVTVRNPERPLSHSIAQRDLWSNPRLTFNLFLTSDKRDYLSRLDSYPRLGDFFEIHEGVHSGNIRARLFVDEHLDESCRELLVGGKEIMPYVLDWRGRYLRLAAVPPRRTREAYANVGRPEWYERRKVVVRRTGDYVLAAVDQLGRYVSNNFFIVFPKERCELDVYGLCALLNSKTITSYFRIIEPREGRAFAELKIKHLSQFPLPLLPNNDCLRLNRLGWERSDAGVRAHDAETPVVRTTAREECAQLDREIEKCVQDLLGIDIDLDDVIQTEDPIG